MGKPFGMAEYDGYPMPGISPDRKPLSKEEEDKMCAELRDKARKIAQNTKIRKEPLYKEIEKQRKIKQRKIS